MKIISVVGTRPNFVKIAPLMRAIHQSPITVHHLLVHTGQHYDYEMSKVFFEDLELSEPDIYLGVGSGTHAEQTGKIMIEFERVLFEENPDLVIVVGDVNSTLAAALTTVKLHIPVAHVEAGLRSFNRRMPEEINRVLADHVADLLFAPTAAAVKNLRQEGLPEERIYLVGDVMYDAALYYGAKAERTSLILEQLDLKPRGYLLATVHRAENTDDPVRLRAIFAGLAAVAQEVPVVLPLHPRTRTALEQAGLYPEAAQRLRLIDPVGYLDMVMLEKQARVIVTDSGGVQKEAFFYRVPCVTLREETEWVETVETGWNTLAGYNPEQIVQAALETRPGVERAFPYGDGRAAIKITGLLERGLC
ncbi:UDP-N-acetylglucosamine 2-epimerase (non-hydrolyzing) [Dehalococcoidia bacterium]|nr:UDP-N-acetylglucosamine 2-epimerase (non-hydrolyzing) [Dehalococcoidia bacterium]